MKTDYTFDYDEIPDNHLGCQCCKSFFPFEDKHCVIAKSIDYLDHYNDEDGHVFASASSHAILTICKKCEEMYWNENDIAELRNLLIENLRLRKRFNNKNHPFVTFFNTTKN